MIDLLNGYKTANERALEIVKRERELRRRKHISQEEMASRIGVSLSTFKRFEKSGDISFVKILEIASVLGVSEDFDNVFDHPDYSKALGD